MTPRFEDRPFQHKAIADMRDALRRYNSIILCAPTGSGKTAIACDATAKAVKRGRSVIFIGDSTEIVDQTSETMDYWGIGHGIIQAGNAKRNPWESVHVATIQTLRNRTLPKKDLVFVDECFPGWVGVDGCRISDIRMGDEVSSFNHISGQVERRPVTGTFKRRPIALVRVVLSDGRTIVCTPGHPFATGSGYLPAAELAKGDEIYEAVQVRDLRTVRVDRVEILEPGSDGEFERMCPDGYVYNLEVEGNHNYFASGFLVHNCHLSRAKSWHEVIQKYIEAGAKVVGLSATPTRLDGKGLGAIFQHIVYCPSIQELTALGYLVPLRIFAPPAPNLNQVHSLAGDYRKDELSTAMDKPKLIGDVVEHYGRLALGRLAILAATSIKHSQHLAEAFRAAGIPAAHCDGSTPREERRRILKSLPARDIMVLCQVDICGKGWDCKSVSAAMDCRPTQSLARYIQFVGRVLRSCENKSEAILLCHSGNVHRHGLPDEPRVWSLEDSRPASSADASFSVSTCRACFATFRPGPTACPYCGAAIIRRERKIEVEDGQLEEIRREQKATAIAAWQQTVAVDKKRQKFEELRTVAAERGYSPKWPAVKFWKTFGNWPPREWVQRSA